MASSVSGKVAFVTGGASGIGAALSDQAGRRGRGGLDRRSPDRQGTAAGASASAAAAQRRMRSSSMYATTRRSSARSPRRCRKPGGSTTCSTMPGIGVSGEIDLVHARRLERRLRREPARRGARHPGGLSDHDPSALRPHREHSVDGRADDQCQPGELHRHQTCRRRDLEDVAGRRPSGTACGSRRCVPA